MPKIGNGYFDKCPVPKEFNTLWISAYHTKTQNQEVCVLECSNSHNNECPSGSICMSAPPTLRNDDVNNICVFKQA